MLTTGIYKHYSGKKYEFLFLAKNANNGDKNLEDLVVYKQLEDYGDYSKNTLWVRSLEEFTEMVEVNGKMINRFTKI